MVNLTHSLINGNTSSKATEEKTSTSNNIGSLAKLMSEMKLIEGLQPIRLTGSQSVFLEQTPVQLISAATENNKQLTLLNTGIPIDTAKNKSAELELNLKQQASRLVLNAKNHSILPPILTSNSTNSASLKSLEISTESGKAPLSDKVATNNISAGSNSLPNETANTQTNRRTILQNVVLASEIKTLKVVGHGVQSDSKTNLLPDTTYPAKAYASKQTVTTNSIAPANNSLDNTPLTTNKVATDQATNPISTNRLNNSSETFQKQSTDKTPNVDNSIARTQREVDAPPLAAYKNEVPAQIVGTKSNNAPVLQAQAEGQPSKPIPQTSNNPITTNSATTNTSNNIQTQSFIVTDGNVNFEVQSQKVLPIGSTIQVLSDPKGQLQVIPQTNAKAPSIINNALSQSLPQQFNETELNTAIKDLQQALSNKDLPPKLQIAIRELLDSFPTRDNLKTTNDVKQSIQSSGLFLENNLLNTTSNKDIKLNWLKLHSATQQAITQTDNNLVSSSTSIPEEQAKIAHQALERITTHQLKTLVEQNKTEFSNTPIILELPIRDKDSTSLVQFHIEKDSSQTESITKEKRRWLAKLRFDFPETGKFEARVRVKENQAGVIFVAEEKGTEQIIRQNFSELKNDLEKKEIELEQLDCFCRSLSEEKVVAPSDRLIDVRT